MFPEFSLFEFFLPRLWITLQSREVRIGSVQESLAAIALNCLIEHRLHGLLFLIGNLPEYCVGALAKSNDRSTSCRLHTRGYHVSMGICIQKCNASCIYSRFSVHLNIDQTRSGLILSCCGCTQYLSS